MTDFSYNIIVTEQNVNYGDHAQDMTHAVSTNPEMTIQELVNRHLKAHDGYEWIERNQAEPDPRKYITIRAEIA